MKNIAISIATFMLMACMTINAQTLPLQSTSAMKGFNSSYTPGVTNVGALKANFIPMYSTSTMREVEAIATPEWDTSGSGSHKGVIRRGFDTGGESGRSDEFPVGEPWIMLLFAAITACVTAARKRLKVQTLLKKNND